ncbi:MAG: hypothetical protein GX589_07945 [Deltaproteobacteria bacterium]|nr:hypothetical protein [Deltaproteobacteria bacterium]
MAKLSQQEKIEIANRNINQSDAWRQIPPEEKLAMMANANSKGLFAAITACIVGGTCAVALQEVWLFWGSLMASPLVYQYAAGKAWRSVKPATILRYLAARSAARRYAYSADSKDLELSLIFRANLERIYGEQHLQEALEAMVRNNKETEVWVGLFPDVVVMLSERPGGAALEFAQPLDDKLTIESQSASGQDYANDKELFLSAREKGNKITKIKLTSRFPGALVVFEKRLLAFQNRCLELAAKDPSRPKPRRLLGELGDNDENGYGDIQDDAIFD